MMSNELSHFYIGCVGAYWCARLGISPIDDINGEGEPMMPGRPMREDIQIEKVLPLVCCGEVAGGLRARFRDEARGSEIIQRIPDADGRVREALRDVANCHRSGVAEYDGEYICFHADAHRRPKAQHEVAGQFQHWTRCT